MCYRDLGNEQFVIYFKVRKHVRTLFSRGKKAIARPVFFFFFSLNHISIIKREKINEFNTVKYFNISKNGTWTIHYYIYSFL